MKCELLILHGLKGGAKIPTSAPWLGRVSGGFMLKIRNAVEADFSELRSMWQEFEEYLNAIDDPSEIVPARFEGVKALAFAAEPKCQIIIAETDGVCAGYLVFHVGVC